MNNLANSKEHRAELERLFAALKDWSVATDDKVAPPPALPDSL
jgi:hypothetical protein